MISSDFISFVAPGQNASQHFLEECKIDIFMLPTDLVNDRALQIIRELMRRIDALLREFSPTKMDAGGYCALRAGGCIAVSTRPSDLVAHFSWWRRRGGNGQQQSR